VLRDCNRTSDFDADLDGYESNTFGGDDCDDQDAGVNPGATERADDTIDNNCDGIAATDPYLKEDLRAGCAGCATQAPHGRAGGPAAPPGRPPPPRRSHRAQPERIATGAIRSPVTRERGPAVPGTPHP
jgi:hypothetical protein